MKKAKFLTLALVVAIMMMGAGYAYWSETLIVDQTIDTGELRVDITNAQLSSSDPYLDIKDVEYNTKYIDFEVNQLYPGATIQYRADVKNNGTLAAVVDIAKSIEKIEYKGGNQELVEQFLKPVVEIYKNGVKVDYREVLRLEPKDTATLKVALTLDPELKNDEFENEYLKFRMGIVYTQFNDSEAISK